MNKKQGIAMWAIDSLFLLCLLFKAQSIALADFEKTYFEDLDGDGDLETIMVHQEYKTASDILPFASEGIITIYDPELEKAVSFSMPDRMGEIEFVSLNKNRHKQIVAWSNGGMHYTNLAIYGCEDDKLFKIFEAGSACRIEAFFNENPPKIKVGIPRFDKRGWSYADEPDWEIWVWGGKKFGKRIK